MRTLAKIPRPIEAGADVAESLPKTERAGNLRESGRSKIIDVEKKTAKKGAL